jgi:hypothetical protein
LQPPKKRRNPDLSTQSGHLLIQAEFGDGIMAEATSIG